MILQIVSWLTVLMGASIMYLAGKDRTRQLAWKMGIANQALWATVAVTTHAWGLIAGCFLYGGVYSRNLIRGRK